MFIIKEVEAEVLRELLDEDALMELICKGYFDTKLHSSRTIKNLCKVLAISKIDTLVIEDLYLQRKDN